MSDVLPNTTRFEKEWYEFLHSPKRLKDGALSAPIVPVGTTLFVGLKLAHARGKPDTAGTWALQSRNIKFDWSNKRTVSARTVGLQAVTMPYTGGHGLWSEDYRDDMEAALLSAISSDEMAEMPDHIDATEMILGG